MFSLTYAYMYVQNIPVHLSGVPLTICFLTNNDIYPIFSNFIEKSLVETTNNELICDVLYMDALHKCTTKIFAIFCLGALFCTIGRVHTISRCSLQLACDTIRRHRLRVRPTNFYRFDYRITKSQ